MDYAMREFMLKLHFIRPEQYVVVLLTVASVSCSMWMHYVNMY